MFLYEYRIKYYNKMLSQYFFFEEKKQALDRIWTDDLVLTKDALCRLSYKGTPANLLYRKNPHFQAIELEFLKVQPAVYNQYYQPTSLC